ncbi:NUDIX hydrolase [Paenibacillus xerothermodurans]|uniref:NUDIX hydrolase n=1 Tax=Paenibacillus xerothermodurans TaxID=1977292 RepID=A0A2W1N7M2_PAEXE|nr:NUDIX hydrolase [Paenibacillus xerothermodurans]PZE19580.1 NUDIX hydrolase [Paenibacillus xerothermodurans]
MQTRAVKVVAIHNNKLVIVKQFREGKRKFTYELPGGRIEHAEQPRQGALRELSEETGLIAGSLKELGTYRVANNPVVVTLYFTDHIIRQQQQHLDNDEQIYVLYVNVDDALKYVGNGTWPDVRLGIGLILARAKGLI